jgi:hypothetical protein
MFRAYKISVDSTFEAMLGSRFVNPTTSLGSNNLRSKLSQMIKNTSLATKGLSADSIWDEWFPEVKADVFISHSSKDGNLAKKFAHWLNVNFELSAFVDSEIWSHSDDLLRELDNKHCLNLGRATYDYDKRNASTAHVHMMLSYALTRMIDKTECFIFLESSNSVTAQGSVDGTYSPWIFHELATVDTIALKPKRELLKVATESARNFSEIKGLEIKYPILGNRLINLGCQELEKWKRFSIFAKCHILDLLYEQTSSVI